MMLPRRCVWLIAALLVTPHTDAHAQSVRGTVSGGGMRVEGAIVLLVDSAGRVVARSASRESGAFSLAAERAGRHTLRVLRIGFAPTVVGPVRLAIGAPFPLDVTLTGAPMRIAELRIVDRAPCEVRPDSDAVAFRLWDEARKALLATTLTQHDQLTMRTGSTQRTLDAGDERVLAESTTVRTIPTVRPFASLTPDSLIVAGYVQRNALGETIYWAPDADVLLSESFASTHCLRPERAREQTGEASRWIGIAFLPSGPARGVADVEGVLWLDANTAELRRLDYRYVRVPDDTRLAERVQAGGRVEFLRLPTGGWIVSRWSIRYPLVRSAAPRLTSVIPGARREAPTSGVELAGIRITSGEVAEVRRGVRTIWERGRVGYRVQVVDAGQQRPLTESSVVMDDSPDTATTGVDGVALFPRVRPGAHRVTVRTATMRLLGVSPTDVGVTVPDQQDAPHVIEVPHASVLLSQACGARVVARRESLLRGSLRTSALPVADTRVEASWPAHFTRLGGGAPIILPRTLVATTNARGEFTMCGLPRGVVVSLRAVRGRPGDATTTVTIPTSAVAAEQSLLVEP
ncbi:MAG: carboxypeptidase-like regulatory domain-containing protein [Gemmatimonadaceae bacterium]